MSVPTVTLTPDANPVPGVGVIAEHDPQTVAEMLARATADDFDRWEQQLVNCGHCARPVRLKGRVTEYAPDGTRTERYSTANEPDGVLLIACKNRRAAVCPSCAYRYAGDMWQLLYAGAVGGRKGVPDTIRAHPLNFVTLTAPSFGPVHTTRADRIRGRKAGRCHNPAGGKLTLCKHGRPTWCAKVHGEDDPCLGEPLCPDCYDYTGHAAFNWWAPELWRRFTIALPRVLARRAGVYQNQFRRMARMSFAKVAEYQRRGVVHFHGLIRLDGSEPFTAPGIVFAPDELADAIIEAARSVSLQVPVGPGKPGLLLRFGAQIKADPITDRHAADGDLTPRKAAAYIAKYATKSADDFGLGTYRITPASLDTLDLSDHTERIVRACWDLGDPANGEDYAALRRWLHMLGFRGHFATKSRTYSTTLGNIRAEQRAYRQRHNPENVRDIGDQVDNDSTLIVGTWRFVGIGYTTSGDAELAAAAAARAREYRDTAAYESRMQDEAI